MEVLKGGEGNQRKRCWRKEGSEESDLHWVGSPRLHGENFSARLQLIHACWWWRKITWQVWESEINFERHAFVCGKLVVQKEKKTTAATTKPHPLWKWGTTVARRWAPSRSWGFCLGDQCIQDPEDAGSCHGFLLTNWWQWGVTEFFWTFISLSLKWGSRICAFQSSI